MKKGIILLSLLVVLSAMPGMAFAVTDSNKPSA